MKLEVTAAFSYNPDVFLQELNDLEQWSNTLTRKQLEKMINEQLLGFNIKLQDNLISTQKELINDNKEFWEKVNIIEAKFGDLEKKNETLQIKVVITKESSSNLFINHKNLNKRIIKMKRNIHWLKQYPCREWIEIAAVQSSRTNDLIEEHVILIFKKL